MSTTPLFSSAEKRALKAQAHALPVTVIVGRSTDLNTAVAALGRQFDQHPLVKVRFAETDRNARQAVATELATASASACLSLTGRVALYARKIQTSRDSD